MPEFTRTRETSINYIIVITPFDESDECIDHQQMKNTILPKQRTLIIAPLPVNINAETEKKLQMKAARIEPRLQIAKTGQECSVSCTEWTLVHFMNRL